jgi:hypothetical protein
MRLFNFIFNHNKNGYRVSSLFLILLNYFNVEVPEGASDIILLSYNAFMISLVALSTFINLIITFYILYYLKDSNFEVKFQKRPLIVKIIKFYSNTSKLSLIIEISICLASIIIILVNTLLMLFILLD